MSAGEEEGGVGDTEVNGINMRCESSVPSAGFCVSMASPSSYTTGVAAEARYSDIRCAIMPAAVAFSDACETYKFVTMTTTT